MSGQGGLLEGRVAVVTGGAQGIGLAIAQNFVEHGAVVVLGDLNLDGALAAAATLGEGRAQAVRCDVTVERDVDALVDIAVDTCGRLDIMVNNAGVTRDGTILKMPIEDFRAVTDTHLVGTWLGTRAAMRVMRPHRQGSIINISSISGKVGNFGQSNYSAAKAGIVAMGKAAAKEAARFGVRVNAIQPGLIRTGMTEAMPKHAWDQKMTEIPLGRAGEPSEVATVATFLASDLASYMTGNVIEVAGGRHM